jgi:hypothetical protein
VRVSVGDGTITVAEAGGLPLTLLDAGLSYGRLPAMPTGALAFKVAGARP